MVDFEDRNFAYGAIAGSLFVLIVYHVVMYTAILSGRGESTQLAQNINNSLRWVLKHREKGDPASATLAVQTFRNTILVAIFVGGNAFSQAFNYANGYPASIGDPVEQARSIVLAALLFSSFLSWACVIRFAAHLGYIIGTLSYNTPPTPSLVSSSSSNTNNTNATTILNVHQTSEVKRDSEGVVSVAQTTDIQRSSELAAAVSSTAEVKASSEAADAPPPPVPTPKPAAVVGPPHRQQTAGEEDSQQRRILKECVRVMSLNMIFFR